MEEAKHMLTRGMMIDTGSICCRYKKLSLITDIFP